MRITASKVDLAQRCAWPFRPDVEDPPRTESDAANSGTAEHARIEDSVVHGTEQPASDTHRRWLLDWWPANQHLDWHTEVALALDPITGETRTGPKWEHRDYAWAPPRMVTATLDALAVP